MSTVRRHRRMAVRWAAHEAGMRNVPLSLIHVIDTPPSGLLALGGAVSSAAHRNRGLAENGRRKDHFGRRQSCRRQRPKRRAS